MKNNVIFANKQLVNFYDFFQCVRRSTEISETYKSLCFAYDIT